MLYDRVQERGAHAHDVFAGVLDLELRRALGRAQLPRVALVGKPALYKLYFITDVLQPGQPIEQNASVDFMRKFIPAANAALFPDFTATPAETTLPEESAPPPPAS